MNDNDILQDLVKGRERYASAPSHAAVFQVVPLDTFCMVTAVPIGIALDTLRRFVPDDEARDLVTFNANHSTEEVLAVFDKAIASMRS